MTDTKELLTGYQNQLRTSKSFVIICIEEPVANSTVHAGGKIAGKGWVVANVELDSIQIYIGGHFCGSAIYGEWRPDIAKQFPTYPQADQSGFVFSVNAPEDLTADHHEMMIVVKTVHDEEIKRIVPLEFTQAADETFTHTHMGLDFRPIRVFVDDARIDENGIFRARGWAASLSPLLELRMYLGKERLGEPEMGLARPDVAQSHPEYSNADNSGFRLAQQVDDSIGDASVLRVQAICAGGVRRHILVPVERSQIRRRSSNAVAGANFCLDTAVVNTLGRVSVSGWAVSEFGVTDIVVELDGVSIGSAQTGLPRPDVGNRFPRIASARNAGFRFTQELGCEMSGEHLLNLRMHEGNGETRDILLPVQAEAGIAEAVLRDDTPASAIKSDLDLPILSGDHARDPVRTALTITGWAIAPEGVDFVEVKVDEAPFGRAYYGMRREDVEAVFPTYDTALLSGFTLVIPARSLSEGEHGVQVIVHSKNGETAQRRFTVLCEKSDEIPHHEMLRDRVGQAEINYGNRVLQAFAPVRFEVFILLDDGLEECAQQARQTLCSLIAQTYRDWHAHIVIRQEDDAAQDFNLGSLDASNVSVGLHDWSQRLGAEHSYVLRLRAGDRLSVDALMEWALHAAQNPHQTVIYADDRRHNATVGHDGPFFKPDWSPDLLLSFNYIGRAYCVRAASVVNMGIGTFDFQTASDHDFVLRLTEHAQAVGHVTRLLLESATCDPRDQMDVSAVEVALQRQGVAASVLPGRAVGTCWVQRHLVAPGRVSVIIPTIAARGLIEITLKGLRENTAWPDLEIICLDNIPPGETAHWKTWLREHADVVVEIAEPFNWSRFNNIGAAAATGEYLLFLNDDIEVLHPNWLEVLVSHAQRPDVGVVGPQLLYPDGKVQHAGIVMTPIGGRHIFRFADGDEPGPFGMALSERDILAVTGACMLMRRAAFEAAGRFNETHSVVNNDVDYCLRARAAGQKVIFTPHARLVHHELVSRAKITDIYDKDAFQKDWGNLILKGDPYFNPNLDLGSDQWQPEAEPSQMVYAGHPLFDHSRVQRILAVKLDHIGDFITALPALRRLKQRFPNAELHVLVAKASLALAELEPCIDTAHEFTFFHTRSGEGQRAVTEDELLELRAHLTPYAFDIAIDLRMQPETRRVLQYTGARFLAGFEGMSLFPWLDLAIPWEGDQQLQAKRLHVSDRMTMLVESLSVAGENERPVLESISRQMAMEYLRALPALAELPDGFFNGTVICVHPGVGSDTRQWPAAHFAGLIDLLVGEAGANIILIGAGEEAAIALEVLERLSRPDGVLSLVGKTNLRDLPYILRACDAYVGNNSGPKHIAAALGVPTLGVHSAVVDTTEWGPLGPNAAAIRRNVFCGPCYLAYASQCARGLACMTGLLPADVYRACRRMLALANTDKSRIKMVGSD